MCDDKSALYFLLGLFIIGIIYVLKIFKDASDL